MAKSNKIKGSNRGKVPEHIPHGADDSSSTRVKGKDYPAPDEGIEALTDHTAERVTESVKMSLNAQTNMLRNLTKGLLQSLLDNK